MTDTSATRHVPSNTPPVDAVPGPIQTAPATGDPDPLRRTRTGVVWIGVIIFAVVLVLLLIFILQNTQPVEISYLGATGHVSLAVAMLLAAMAGLLLTAIAGSLRIWQLRRRLRRSAR
ncbi:lipopolysaccharide assembly protein LapA domain-containing protein [Actinocrispum wychmicini]|uniref:Putative integral membrane protein n=1 Tax=Actinocrispum wychmicini TaxID=1213861 RepID=A0A4R2JY81_9PSEU|nr:lipopolysaccharide assembly protein LapA domain-containing protein [Actinocrispum wychmicini]TCO62199.1 putative integral membrane protein [Actinocrispum wychmicini]